MPLLRSYTLFVSEWYCRYAADMVGSNVPISEPLLGVHLRCSLSKISKVNVFDYATNMLEYVLNPSHPSRCRRVRRPQIIQFLGQAID